MKDNRGVTLIELLVALATGAIVMAGAASLLTTGLKLYAGSNANSEIADEAQTSFSLIVDHIMEAEGLCLEELAPGDNRNCILLGDLVMQKEASGDMVYFRGNALIADYAAAADSLGNPLGELYLVEFPNEANAVTEINGTDYAQMGGSMEVALGNARAYMLDKSPQSRLPWLMSRNVTAFQAVPVPNPETLTVGGTRYFEEPFTLQISVSLKLDYGNDSVSSTVTSRVSVRSRLQRIYIGGKVYGRK